MTRSVPSDAAKLTKAAEFWNTGWTTKPGTLPAADLIPSSGPYKLKSWNAGESVTLEANETYYGTPAATKNLTFRFLDDDAMVQALDNDELNVIAPQPTIDTLAQLKKLGDKVNIQQGDTMTWEHLDFNFRDKAVFKDSLELRQAFAMCVPRQEIVDNLIKPLNPEAQVLNAREVFPFQENYKDVVGLLLRRPLRHRRHRGCQEDPRRAERRRHQGPHRLLRSEPAPCQRSRDDQVVVRRCRLRNR